MSPADEPAVFYLPDSDGNLRRVIGYRYEDFLKDQGLQHSEESAGAIIESLRVSGKVVGDHAELLAKLTIVKSSRSRTGVPIDLGGAVLEEVRFPNEANESSVTFNAERNAYELWLSKQLHGRFNVEIKFTTPVENLANLRRFALNLPQAAKSELEIEVPGTDLDIMAPSVRMVTKKRRRENGSRLEVSGVAGVIDISWLPVSAGGNKPSQIEAELNIRAKLTPEEISYYCLISATTNSRPIESYRIELPVGFELAEEVSDESYRVRKVSAAKTEPSRENPKQGETLVEIRFPAPVSEPPLVVFSAIKAVRSDRSSHRMVLAVPRILGIHRQSGFLSVATSDRLQSYYDLAGSVEQIAASQLPEELSVAEVAAAFRYAGTSGEVVAHTQPRIERIRVRPQYKLSIENEDATLAVDLGYEISAARLFSLRIDLKDWELTEEPVESGGLVESSRLHVNNDGILILPFASPAEETARVRFTLRRPVSRGLNRFSLPQPLGTFALPGKLSMTAASALKVTPQLDETKGIAIANKSEALDSNTATRRNGIEDSSETAMQFAVFSPQAELAISVTDRPGEVQVSSELDVSVRSEEVLVKQSLGYLARFKSLQQVGVIAPRALWENGALGFRWDGQELATDAVKEFVAAPSSEIDSPLTDARKIKLEIALPRLLKGEGLLEIQYSIPRDVRPTNSSASIDLPLIEPLAPLESTIARISNVGDLYVAIDTGNNGSAWTSVEAKAASLDPLKVEYAGVPSSLPIEIGKKLFRDKGKLRLDRVWAQTWLAGRTKQDRLAYRITTNRQKVTLSLPETWINQQLEVALDGQVQDSIELDGSNLVVDLPESDQALPHTIELRIMRQAASSGWRSLELRIPKILNTSANAPFYWHIVAPGSLVLSGSSKNISGEYQLGWRNLRWGRQPLQSQSDLEQWAGALRAPIEPGVGTSQYVFSSLAAPSFVEGYFISALIPQCLTVAVIFALGVLSIYTALWRRALFWLVLSSLLILVVLTQPDLAFAASQLVIVAAGLVAATALLRRWLTVEPALQSSAYNDGSIDIQTVSTGIWNEPENLDPAATIAQKLTPEVPASGVSNIGGGS
ncbi:MAG: hypothetical protein RH917_05455 [Lacipirellulaceae bacterium]